MELTERQAERLKDLEATQTDTEDANDVAPDRFTALSDRFRESVGVGTLGHLVAYMIEADYFDGYDTDRVVQVIEDSPEHFWDAYIAPMLQCITDDATKTMVPHAQAEPTDPNSGSLECPSCESELVDKVGEDTYRCAPCRQEGGRVDFEAES